jgi:hypothetical protein
MESHKRRLALILLVLWAAAAVKVAMMRADTRKLLAREIPRDLGMGDSLKAMVEVLEKDLAERTAFEPPGTKDPLALHRVVRLAPRNPDGKEAAENGRMRLSATVLSPGNFTAIIKYQGRSHTLAVGDSLDHRVVKSIDKRTVVLDYQGKPLVLVNEPAPKAEAQSEGNVKARIGRLEDLDL